jgi:hypothetical protein
MTNSEAASANPKFSLAELSPSAWAAHLSIYFVDEIVQDFPIVSTRPAYKLDFD